MPMFLQPLEGPQAGGVQQFQRTAGQGRRVADLFAVGPQTLLVVVPVVPPQVFDPHGRFLRILGLAGFDQLVLPQIDRRRIVVRVAAAGQRHGLVGERGEQSRPLRIRAHQRLVRLADGEQLDLVRPLGLDRRVGRQHEGGQPHAVGPQVQPQHRLAGPRRRDDVQAAACPPPASAARSSPRPPATAAIGPEIEFRESWLPVSRPPPPQKLGLFGKAGLVLSRKRLIACLAAPAVR